MEWQWLGSVTVKTLNLRSKGRRFDSRSGRYQVVTTTEWVTVCGQVNYLGITNPNVNSAFHLPRLVNRVPACLAGVEAGRVHLCRVAGNTV